MLTLKAIVAFSDSGVATSLDITIDTGEGDLKRKYLVVQSVFPRGLIEAVFYHEELMQDYNQYSSVCEGE